MEKKIKYGEWGREYNRSFSTMPLSVVITTYNRKDVLKGLLDCLKKQTDKDFETIVVMDGCTDDTEQMLKQYNGLNLRWLNTKMSTYGLATARNMGIRDAKDGPVVILDDDSYPDEDFVKQHKKTAKRGTLVGGARLPDTKEDVDMLLYKMQDTLNKYGTTPKRLNSFIVENNTCMMRSNWLQVPFDESIQHYGGIGQDFIKRLIEGSYMFQFNPEAKITHMSKYKRRY